MVPRIFSTCFFGLNSASPVTLKTCMRTLSLDDSRFVVADRAFSKNRLRLRRIVYAAFIGRATRRLQSCPVTRHDAKALSRSLNGARGAGRQAGAIANDRLLRMATMAHLVDKVHVDKHT